MCDAAKRDAVAPCGAMPTREGAGSVGEVADAQDVRRAFEAARRRFCEADSFDVQRDEASNMLGHLSRLIALKGRSETIADEPSAETARKVLLFRHKDVHDVAEIATSGDVFTDALTNLFGVLVWAAAPEVVEDRRYGPYGVAEIIGRPVVDTLAAAFDEVDALP